MSVLESRCRRWHLRHAGGYDSLSEVLVANRDLSADDISNSPDLLHDPFVMRGMTEAVERLGRALDDGEKIVVFGDYDVDGVTSTAVLLDFLRHRGADVSAMIPNRLDDGYGLRPASVDRAVEGGARLIVTVDNGISAIDAVDRARRAGVDVVIVDHHLPLERLPDAVAVIDPNRADCPYPFKGLAAVGLAFKLVQALSVERMPGDERRRYLNSLLDLVALGTVADLAPMVGENRLLTRHGLKVLARQARPGLRALLGLVGVGDKAIDAMTIGFLLGPRLNSAGRLASADLSLDLLMATERQAATGLAQDLDTLNSRRRHLQDEGVKEAEDQVTRDGLDSSRIVVVHSRSWSLGVVGLIAGRLAEAQGRPALALTAEKGDGTYVGSARTVGDYDIAAAIFRCAEHLVDFGGHAAAAGLTVKAENLPALVEQLTADAERLLPEEAHEPELEIDLVLRPGDISLATVAALEVLAPFGKGNEAPIFMARDCRVSRLRAIGKEGAHLKLELTTEGRSHDAVWWRQGDKASQISVGDRLDAAFSLESNTWRGRTRVQLRLEDLRSVAE